MEAQDLGPARAPDRPLAAGAAERVRRIEHERQAVSRAGGGEALGVADVAEQVYADHGPRLLRDRPFDFRRARHQGVGGDVAEHRDEALPDAGVGGGHERERGEDDLSLQLQGAQEQDLGDRAVAHDGAVPDGVDPGDLLLELPDERSVVGQPVPVEDLRHEALVSLPRPRLDDRRADRQRAREGRLASQQRQAHGASSQVA